MIRALKRAAVRTPVQSSRFAAMTIACALGAIACRQTASTGPQAPGAADGDAVRQPTGSAPDVAVSDAARPAPAAESVFGGTTEGRSVDPPIREFVRNFPTDPWTGRGTLSITVPRADGVVSGELRFDGLSLELRGRRYGSRITATLEQLAPSAGPDAGLSVDPFHGTLDATLDATALAGSWEMSAQAGYHRRSGTFRLESSR